MSQEQMSQEQMSQEQMSQEQMSQEQMSQEQMIETYGRKATQVLANEFIRSAPRWMIVGTFAVLCGWHIMQRHGYAHDLATSAIRR